MKVKKNLINILAKRFGEPNWPDTVFMSNQWEEAFGGYASEDLNALAIKYIRQAKFKSFPEIAHIFDIIGAQGVEKENMTQYTRPVKDELYDDYIEFSKWYRRLLSMDGKFGEPTPKGMYPYTTVGMREDSVKYIIDELRNRHPELVEGCNFREEFAVGWHIKWLPAEVDKRLKALNDVHMKKVANYTHDGSDVEINMRKIGY